jgi:putative hemolysin
MLPRTQVVALPRDASAEQVWHIVRSERYSRYPVFGESLDDIVGVFLAKDLWLYDDSKPFELHDWIREALYVPDARPAELVLNDLKRTRAHLAVVLDEYGGTAGIVTLEDLVEEIVGDIADEYDVIAREASAVGGVLELAGSMSLVDVRSDYGVPIPEGDWTTLGGYVFSAFGHLPKAGDRVAYPGGHLEVIAMEGRRVAAVRVRPALGREPRDAPST